MTCFVRGVSNSEKAHDLFEASAILIICHELVFLIREQEFVFWVIVINNKRTDPRMNRNDSIGSSFRFHAAFYTPAFKIDVAILNQ